MYHIYTDAQLQNGAVSVVKERLFAYAGKEKKSEEKNFDGWTMLLCIERETTLSAEGIKKAFKDIKEKVAYETFRLDGATWKETYKATESREELTAMVKTCMAAGYKISVVG